MQAVLKLREATIAKEKVRSQIHTAERKKETLQLSKQEVHSTCEKFHCGILSLEKDIEVLTATRLVVNRSSIFPPHCRSVINPPVHSASCLVSVADLALGVLSRAKLETDIVQMKQSLDAEKAQFEADCRRVNTCRTLSLQELQDLRQDLVARYCLDGPSGKPGASASPAAAPSSGRGLLTSLV